MPVCLQIMQALKMHKGVNELRLLSNTLTYQSWVDFQSQRNSLNGPRVSAASATRK